MQIKKINSACLGMHYPSDVVDLINSLSHPPLISLHAVPLEVIIYNV